MADPSRPRPSRLVTSTEPLRPSLLERYPGTIALGASVLVAAIVCGALIFLDFVQ